MQSVPVVVDEDGHEQDVAPGVAAAAAPRRP